MQLEYFNLLLKYLGNINIKIKVDNNKTISMVSITFKHLHLNFS